MAGKLAKIETIDYGLGEYVVTAQATIVGNGWDQESALRSLIEQLENHAKAIREQMLKDSLSI